MVSPYPCTQDVELLWIVRSWVYPRTRFPALGPPEAGRRLTATSQQLESIFAAVYQVYQRLWPINTLNKLRSGRPWRNTQYSGQVHPVLQPGHWQIPGHVEVIGRRILLVLDHACVLRHHERMRPRRRSQVTHRLGKSLWHLGCMGFIPDHTE